jgi:DNA-directed RNA polymerase specialized sigma24 family protein
MAELARTKGAFSRRRAGACWRAELTSVSEPTEGLDDPDSLIAGACAGDEAAWQELWRWLDPQLDALVRRRRVLGRFSQRDDERRGLVLQVMGKLRQDGFRRLEMYRQERARNPALTLLGWLTVVTRNAAVDYLRAHPDYRADGPRTGAQRPGGLRELLPLPSGSRGPGNRPPVTALGTAGELLAYARRELPERQRRALELWMAGHGAADIAEALGLGAPEAERLVRAAVERLRRQFRTASAAGAP